MVNPILGLAADRKLLNHGIYSPHVFSHALYPSHCIYTPRCILAPTVFTHLLYLLEELILHSHHQGRASPSGVHKKETPAEGRRPEGPRPKAEALPGQFAVG